ncbi:conserved hypothetical protein [Methanocaldococcus vulcanius M7]|uniref:Uncharacterized protein n=1 Tax=Methanocaldococcus vulcanius (strain ATCC 700851 / DSM 12094 / M7) TaxID=579137 RepID=C9RF19_METVM|nr:hypothetical protein [Methanocaldococcus vulcanius]ACX72171.1 conserved hypothetical protein [Methanocaldococcus vulcanius M7]
MLGIAVKPSKIKDILNFGKFVRKYFDYYVIDAENNIITDEDILEKLDKLSNVVMTIQAKRENAFRLVELYGSYNFIQCIVLGNSYYLSEREKKYKNNRILEVIEKALEYDVDVWVGTEGVEQLVKNIVEDNDLVSYYIYGQGLTLSSKKAIYVPFAKDINNSVLTLMKGYLKRRKNYHGNWEKFILSLNDKENIDAIKNNNDIIIGFPIFPNREEVLNFLEMMK